MAGSACTDGSAGSDEAAADTGGDDSSAGADATGGAGDSSSASATGDTGFAGSDDAGSGGPEGDDPDDTGAPLTGEGLFLQLCAACHGADAMGTDLAYELRHPHREHATWVVRNGRPGDEFENSVMAPFSPEALSDAELELIFDFLDAFPQPDTPEGLYLDYCRNCHGPDARGGVVGVDIVDQELGDIEEKVRDGEGDNPGARTSYMPARGSDVLSDAEVEAIAGFIASLPG